MTRVVLRKMRVIPSRHALVSQHQHGEVQHVEADEDGYPGNNHPFLTIHFSKHLREPMQECGKKSNYCSTEHHIMKMPDHPVGIMQMNVDAQRPLNKSGQSTDGKKKYEAQGK